MATESGSRYTLDHLTDVSKEFIALVAVLGVVALVWLEALIHQLQYGLIATDLAAQGTQGGVTWGLYIGTFEWFAGMAVGTLAVVGYLRYNEIDEYSTLARIGTVWAFISGISAALLIVVDLGTPWRVLYVLQRWPQSVLQSPLAWDVTFVTTLLVFTLTMLVISLRLDFLKAESEFPLQTRLVERLVGLGATREEIPKLESMRKWLGLGVMVLAFTGGMVPGLLMGVVGGQPGFFGSEAGIVFLSAGLLSGVAMLTLLTGIPRLVYGWGESLPDRMFITLGRTLTVFGFVFLVVLFNDIVPILTQMAPYFEQRIGESMIAGHLAPYFWAAILLVGVPTLVLAVVQERLGVVGQMGAAALILVGVWIKSILTVIEPLMYPNLPIPTGTYSPTAVEWVLSLGMVAIAILLFSIAMKIIPLDDDPGTEVSTE
ncbi:MAG: NrfD/PsrC family molybdoenzyme membrane anchor subunit [Haloferacaceae archaeon]